MCDRLGFLVVLWEEGQFLTEIKPSDKHIGRGGACSGIKYL